jgi:hypothetical protein
VVFGSLLIGAGVERLLLLLASAESRGRSRGARMCANMEVAGDVLPSWLYGAAPGSSAWRGYLSLLHEGKETELALEVKSRNKKHIRCLKNISTLLCGRASSEPNSHVTFRCQADLRDGRAGSSRRRWEGKPPSAQAKSPSCFASWSQPGFQLHVRTRVCESVSSFGVSVEYSNRLVYVHIYSIPIDK